MSALRALTSSGNSQGLSVHSKCVHSDIEQDEFGEKISFFNKQNQQRDTQKNIEKDVKKVEGSMSK